MRIYAIGYGPRKLYFKNIQINPPYSNPQTRNDEHFYFNEIWYMAYIIV